MNNATHRAHLATEMSADEIRAIQQAHAHLEIGGVAADPGAAMNLTALAEAYITLATRAGFITLSNHDIEPPFDCEAPDQYLARLRDAMHTRRNQRPI